MIIHHKSLDVHARDHKWGGAITDAFNQVLPNAQINAKLIEFGSAK